MPRFYFDLQNGSGMRVDDIGSELEDIDQAVKEALSLISHFVKDNLLDDKPKQFIAYIRDGSSRPICRATLNFKCERLYNPKN